MTMDLSGDAHRLLRDLDVRKNDFAGAFMAVHGLTSLVSTHPDLASMSCVQGFGSVLSDPRHRSQSKAFFLYRLAAEGLTNILNNCRDREISRAAMEILHRALNTASGKTLKATAEAVGTLPLNLPGHCVIPDQLPGNGRFPCLAQMLHDTQIYLQNPPAVLGRSLVYDLTDTTLLVLKFARTGACLPGLCNEARWMHDLRDRTFTFPEPFDLPTPLLDRETVLCRGPELAAQYLQNGSYHPEGFALPFIAPRTYFKYPNDHRPGRRLNFTQFLDCMEHNASLLGYLLGNGLDHTAPIPLFHNRVQRERRNDQGVYEWHRGGRLDQWLDSCLYPNFGLSGLRDLEHLEPLENKGPRLFRAVGTHFLSLLLVLGSYFRNSDPDLRGLTFDGKPIDARHLFDRTHFAASLEAIFNAYSCGFLGCVSRHAPPFDPSALADRMIEEMGRDSHMTETLRIQDQLTMDRETFRAFLMGRGYTGFEAGRLLRGAQDVDIMTGPHLGGFNQPISLPELIEAIAAMSATCILEKYLLQQHMHPLHFSPAH